MLILSFLIILDYLYKNITLMVLRFFKKRMPKNKLVTIRIAQKNKPENIDKKITITNDVKPNEVKKNKKEKKQKVMDFKDKMKQVEETLVAMEPQVKVVKSDKGLIERTESSKIILTEDNRQLLND